MDSQDLRFLNCKVGALRPTVDSSIDLQNRLYRFVVLSDEGAQGLLTLAAQFSPGQLAPKLSFLAVGFLTMRNGTLDYDVASSYYTTRIYEERGVNVHNG